MSNSDIEYMDHLESEEPQAHDEKQPQAHDEKQECVVCGREAVAIDRHDAPMCAKHAAMFVTRDYRDAVADKARIVR
jgi:hypothetical protein